ncbi:ErfK/YbiS/YcfS/YnhG family protein [Flavobacteriaceae bacterium 3519-10]|nr:ErfK/YbiS/YcfS/YnhG family protein [Flavobacteriaceae bacterium 3519-10]
MQGKSVNIMFGKKLMMSRLFKITLILVALVAVVQCKKENTQIVEEPVVPKDSAIQAENPKPEISYKPFVFPEDNKDSAMAVFNKQYSEEEQYTILALNRLDSKNKWRADTLAVPDQFDHTLMSYSPFPDNLQILADVNKFVLFSYPIQAYALYEKGRLVKWGPTSMGKKSAQTKQGLMFGNWKKELAISTVDSEWKLPYNFNVHNTLGIGWHQYDLPGFPASHSCLRLLMDDAKFLYKWADQWVLDEKGTSRIATGTSVIVFGEYNWGGKKPWKNLLDDPAANDVSVTVLHAVIEPHLAEIMEEQANREEVLAQKSAVKIAKPAA